MRNPDMYYYCEVALPKGNEAVEACVARAERDHIPLRVLIKEAVINAYEDAPVAESRVSRPKAKRTSAKPRAKKHTASDSVSASAVSSAAAFLDDEGF